MIVRAALLLLSSTLAAAAQTSPAPSFAEALQQARTPLIVADGKFSGAGADVLGQAVAASRFVLVGEDHFSHEIPQFVGALCGMMHPDAYAIEAGPEAANFAGGLLRSPDRLAQTAARLKQYPGSLAFLDFRDESDLTARCAASSHTPDFALWGLDQEFFGAAGALLAEMRGAGGGPRTEAALAAAQSRERADEEQARKTGNAQLLFLLASSDAEVLPLQEAVEADGTAVQKGLLDELLVSRTIYRLHFSDTPKSQQRRAELLKRHLLADYQAMKTSHAAPRVLFKFGDTHMGKGFNELHQRDLGNFVAELADGEGAKSLHLFILAARGTLPVIAGYARPPEQEHFVLADDASYRWLAPAIDNMLPPGPNAAATATTLFDLRTLRYKGIDLPGDWQRIVYSYDLLVLEPEFTPDVPIE